MEDNNVSYNYVSSCNCKIPSSKKMRTIVKTFTIEAPVYKGNAVLNAQK